MVHRIMHDITWFRRNEPLNEEALSALSSFPFQLPKKYLSLLEQSNGGAINNSDFEYYDGRHNSYTQHAIGFIYGIGTTQYNLIKEYFSPPEFFPEGLVAFAETGNGDLICFDYRNDPKTSNPPIVYWNHEAEVGKDVSFIAKDFEEFLTMLKEPED